MSQQEIKLRFRSFDHRVLDKSVARVVEAVKKIGLDVSGPIPVPSKIKKFAVNRSTHVDKRSMEQFQISNHSRLLFISDASSAMSALMALDLSSGVDVEIELTDG